MKRSTSHRRHSATLILVGALIVATPASATNWIMLQGTETDKTPAYKSFGFVGVEYQKTRGADLAAGPWKGQPLVLNQIGPGLESSSELQVSYARVGLRGRLLDGKLNYWISPLAGYNGISYNGSPNVKFTDLSATFNLIPHARIRIGQFKYPGSEEGLEPVVLQNFVNPTSVNKQIVNERFFDSDGTRKDNVYDGPLSGWRDTGIQVFDAFKTAQWEHTYALMAGTGTGLAIYNGLGVGRPDWHLYWSSELVFGGKGPHREGLKLTGWYQDGRREIRTGKEQTEETFGRNRCGLGATFRKGAWRAAGEWIKADGMIFNGTDGAAVPGALSNGGKIIASYNVLPEDKADRWYLDGGYTLFDKWEIRARYDRLNRGTDERDTERRFETFTLGLTYRHNKHFRVLADYELRDVDAPGLPGSAPPSQILSKVDDRFAIRLWAKF